MASLRDRPRMLVATPAPLCIDDTQICVTASDGCGRNLRRSHGFIGIREMVGSFQWSEHWQSDTILKTAALKGEHLYDTERMQLGSANV